MSGGVEPVDVGEQHQHVRFQHRSHARGQAVIVAITDLRRGDSIVLVDDRHGAERQQGPQRLARVEITPALFSVLQGQENLRNLDIVAMERIDIGLREPDLTDCGRGLAFLQTQRA